MVIWGRLRDSLVSATEARVGVRVVCLCVKPAAELARVDEQLGRVQAGGGSVHVTEGRRSRRRLEILGRYLHARRAADTPGSGGALANRRPP